MSENFWEKVRNCKHENLSPQYSPLIGCWTEYSSGYEEHCLDCGIYITTCPAGCCNGMSGWSSERWRLKKLKEMKDMVIPYWLRLKPDITKIEKIRR